MKNCDLIEPRQILPNSNNKKDKTRLDYYDAPALFKFCNWAILSFCPVFFFFCHRKVFDFFPVVVEQIVKCINTTKIMPTFTILTN